MYSYFKLVLLILLLENHPTSAETPTRALFRLIELDDSLRRQSFQDIESVRSKTANAINFILNSQLLPDLENALVDFKTRIEEIGSEVPVSDGASCLNEVAEARSRITNDTTIISNAIEEKDFVYDRILQHLFQIGSRKIASISAKIADISVKWFHCIEQPHPELCSVQIQGEIMARFSNSPKEYEEVVENMKSQMSHFEVGYHDRYKIYVNTTNINLQLFIDLMESCVSTKMS